MESLVPASNEKLPVTAAALLLLGPEFRFRTAAFAGGPINSGGIVEGPLLIHGSGDPTAEMDLFGSLVSELRKRGLSGCCGLWVSGALTGCAKDGPEISRGLLAQALGKAKFSVNQAIGVVPASANTHLLVEHLSDPLGHIILAINKQSRNSWCDNLWRSLAWMTVGDTAQMPSFLQRFWRDRALNMKGVQFADGSGLSRRNRATPAFYVGLLRHMNQCTIEWPAFVGSLPIAGRDGTLANRMTKGPARGRVWAKTGTMHDIATLSGYAETLEGRLLAFSLMMNNLTCPRESARYLQDAACHIIVQLEDS